MNHFRRRTLAAAAMLPFVACGTFAQETYPSKPVTLMVGFAPGGGTDLIAR